MGSILFKLADGEARERRVYIGSTSDEAVSKRDSRGSALDVARAPEKQGNSMNRGVDVAIQVDRSCAVTAVLEKEVEGLEGRLDGCKSTINRRNVMITGMKRKLDDKDEYIDRLKEERVTLIKENKHMKTVMTELKEKLSRYERKEEDARSIMKGNGLKWKRKQ